MRAGRSWVDQAHVALENCAVVLLLMTPKSVQFDSECRTECIAAQASGRPVIPLRFSAEIELYPTFVLPYSIWIDFTASFDERLLVLNQEIGNVEIEEASRGQIPAGAWEPGAPCIGANNLPGWWLVSRKMRKGERFAVIPDYLLHIMPTRRFHESVRGRLGRVAQQTGVWSYETDGKVLTLLSSEGNAKQLAIDTELGPNSFGGLVDGDRRFVARRMLELDNLKRRAEWGRSWAKLDRRT